MTRKTLKFTAEHAASALHILIADGKLAATDVTRALKRREALIRQLRERLATLEGRVTGRISGFTKASARKTERKPKRRLSAARRASLRLHGKYLGAVRALPKAARAKVKATREKSGVTAAIRAARKLKVG